MGASEPRWPAYVREEIENWIVACWDGQEPGPTEPSQCGSLEGRFSALDWYANESPPKRYINHEAARKVQAVFERMSQLTRQVIRYEYTCRSQYDVWDSGLEIGPDGQERRVWHRTANIKRDVARRTLGISRVEYDRHVQVFRDAVGRAFA
ncbi:hypothetical protein AAV32_09645 [Kerstersia gyiorum]|uniref:Uncharacterized protein n=1 Tax=Kerstersia gyiorum TaxID=206506 RepID=A0A171KSG0_9BURK|nr:hypothetical protein AAV32_09645 [Kerstersia gyiorum]